MASVRFISCTAIILAGFSNTAASETITLSKTGPIHKEEEESHPHTHVMELFADGAVEHHQEYVAKDGDTTTSPKFHFFALSPGGHVSNVDANHARIQGPLLEHEYEALLRKEAPPTQSLSAVAASRLKNDGDGRLLRTELTPAQLSELAEISSKNNKDGAVFPKQLIRKVKPQPRGNATAEPLLRTELPKNAASMLQTQQSTNARSNQSTMVRTEMTQEAMDKHEQKADKNVFPKQLIRKAKKLPKGNVTSPLLREGETHHAGADSTDGQVMRTELPEEEHKAHKAFFQETHKTSKVDAYDGHLLRTELRHREDQATNTATDDSHLLRTEMTEEAMKVANDKAERHQDRAVFPKSLIRRAKKQPRGNVTGPLLRDGHQADALLQTHEMVNATHFINGSRKRVVRTEMTQELAPIIAGKAASIAIDGASGGRRRYTWTTGNGFYYQTGTYNGKPEYKNSVNDKIRWEAGGDWAVNAGDMGTRGSKWVIQAGIGHHRYGNTQDTAAPPRTGWHARPCCASGDITVQVSFMASQASTGHWGLSGNVNNYGSQKPPECLDNSATTSAASNAYGNELGVTCCDSNGVGSRPGCVKAATFGSASSYCASQGLSLCTKAQIQAQAGAGSGCSFDAYTVWTSDSCQVGALVETKATTNATDDGRLIRTELTADAIAAAEAKKTTTNATDDGRLMRTELTADAIAAAEAKKATTAATDDGRLMRTELTADAIAAADTAAEAKAVFPKRMMRRAKTRPRGDGKEGPVLREGHQAHGKTAATKDASTPADLEESVAEIGGNVADAHVPTMKPDAKPEVARNGASWVRRQDDYEEKKSQDKAPVKTQPSPAALVEEKKEQDKAPVKTEPSSAVDNQEKQIQDEVPMKA